MHPFFGMIHVWKVRKGQIHAMMYLFEYLLLIMWQSYNIQSYEIL